MHPRIRDFIGAGLLALVLGGMVAAIVVSTWMAV